MRSAHRSLQAYPSIAVDYAVRMVARCQPPNEGGARWFPACRWGPSTPYGISEPTAAIDVAAHQRVPESDGFIEVTGSKLWTSWRTRRTSFGSPGADLINRSLTAA